ncbi:MAG: hypothetical protein JXM70_24055 [Pirellulales bacterium]|nr:hypothetical protein [Pirellulales bacterium]
MELNGKSRSDIAGKPISIKKLAGPVLVLLAAVGIGMAIREFRFRSFGGRRVAQAPKAVEPAEVPEIHDVYEPAPVEEVLVEAEPVAPEPVSPPAEVVEASDTAEQAAGPVEGEPGFDEAKVKEKRGRAALALIGYDPAADAVWISVINDPSVSANARSNLIEDLNEDGFADPHNTTWDDVPVIKYRIALIEELRPYAMDKTNADAFDEAHKDLVNMANRLNRQ